MSAVYTAAELAERIGKTEHWVKRHASQLPHRRFGRSIRWTEEDVEQILAAARRRGEASELRPIGRRRSGSAA